MFRVAARGSGREPPSAGARVFADTEDHAVVQARLGLAYGIFAGVLTGFFVLSIVASAFILGDRFREVNVSTSRFTHLAAIFGLATAAWICRGKPRPMWLLAIVDLVGASKMMAFSAIMVAFAPRGIHVELMIVIVFVFVVALRAALVPSPPKWTAIVCAVASVPVPFGVYAAATRDGSYDAATFPVSALIVMTAGWCVAGTVAAYTISKVVYGLRTEVKTAMRLGQYTLGEKIGEGGMGSVYRAQHALLRRPTAVKLLPDDRKGGVNVKRFEREVQLTSRLTHPNTIAIYDYGRTRDGVFYYAMELLDGVSLQELCEDDGPQPPGRTAHVLAQAASALAEAHDVGLIHRDVKPANIFLTVRGGIPDFVKVLDFGLVKDANAATGDGPTDPALSAANTIAGTPLYMAPESITRPAEVDARVDLYALGAVGYWLLTARAPFEGSNLVEICSHHLHTEPTPPSAVLGAPVPDALEALVLKCLAKNPEDRPASARELALALRDVAGRLSWGDAEARAWWEDRRSRTSSRVPAAAAENSSRKAG